MFEEVSTGKRYLAIRGTDDLDDVVTDLISIATIGTPALQLQYNLLKIKVEQWLASGVLPSTFSITGHSLGGFLATGVGADFSSHIEHVYLYNAPGLNGILGNATSGVLRLLGVPSPIDPSKVSNLKADAGFSLIAGAGYQVSPPISIAIENQLLSDVPNSPAAKNHSQQVLTDSLAVHAAYQLIDGSADVSAIGHILKTASARNVLALESGVYLLGKLFGQLFPPGTENRDELYSALEGLRTIVTQGGYGDAFRIHLLSTAADTHLKASQPGAEGLAYRYALKELNPFALVGSASIYANHNGAERLDLYDPVQGTGTLTDQWLKDRAEFLVWKNQQYEKDIADNVALVRKDFGAESLLFTDMSISPVTGSSLSVRVTGGNVLQQTDPRRISFGSEQSDSLTGGRYADHLYGDGGADALSGGEGDDYLEGGRGSDSYHYVSTDDLGGYDRIFDLDGQGTLFFDGQALSGGHKASGNRYLSDDGRFSYVFVSGSDGRGTLIINDVIEVRHFRNGDLGVSLQSSEATADYEYVFLYRGGEEPIGGPEDDPHYHLGSDFGDEYQAGGPDHEGEFVAGFYPGYFKGKSGNDRFLGSYIWAEDRAYGGPGDDLLEGAALGQGLLSQPNPGGGDYLSGDAGQDVIVGSQFSDRLFGDWELPFARFVEGSSLSGPVLSLSADRIQFDLNSHQYIVSRTENLGSGSDTRMFSSLPEAVYYVLGIADESDIAALFDDVVEGLEGNDYIAGGPGSDFLSGGEGDDEILGDFNDLYYREIIGTSGADRGFGPYAYLLGLPGDDVLDSGDGDDILIDGYGGSDSLYGGPGNDTLVDVDRQLSDLLYQDGTAPLVNLTVNFLDGGEGDDSIVSGNPFGFSQILGGEGHDSIEFSGERAFTADEHDQIAGSTGASVYIDGGEGHDVMTLESGQAEVRGGPGSDSITASADFLRIDQSGSEAGDIDELILPAWNSTDVLLSRSDSDLVLSNRRSGDVVVFSQWFDGSEFEMDAIVLDDRTWQVADIAAELGRSRAPSPGDDLLFATFPQVLAAGEGNDLLIAHMGPVLLNGEAGEDEIVLPPGLDGFIAGGTGDDLITAGGVHSVIAFNRGDGEDTVHLYGGTISLGSGIALGDITVSELDQGYVLDLGGGDSLTLLDAFDSPWGDEDAPMASLRLQILAGEQADIYDLRDLQSAPTILSGAAIGGWVAHQYALDGSLAAVADDVALSVLDDPDFGIEAQSIPQATPFAPFVLIDVQDQQAEVGSSFNLVVPADVFLDVDSAVVPVLSVTRQDGATLPAWLNFSSAARSLQGLPGAEDAGQLALRLTATDADGLSASELFTITIAAVEDEVVETAPPATESPVFSPPTPEPPAPEPAPSSPSSQDVRPESEPGIQPESPPVLADQSGPSTVEPVVDQPAEAVPAAVMAAANDAPVDNDEPNRLVVLTSPDADSPGNVLRPLLAELPAGQGEEEPASGRRDGFRSPELVAEAVPEPEANSGADPDAAFLSAGVAREIPLPVQPGVTEVASYGLSSWEITNALLQFHLEKNAAAAAENALGIGYAPPSSISGMAVSTEALMLGLAGIGTGYGQLQSFSGLEEGLRSLGEVRIA